MSDNYNIDDIINKWEKRKNEAVDKRIPEEKQTFSIDDSATDKINDSFETAKTSVSNFIDKTKKSDRLKFTPQNHIKWIKWAFIATIITSLLGVIPLFFGLSFLLTYFILIPSFVYLTWNTIDDKQKNMSAVSASLCSLIPIYNCFILFYLSKGLNSSAETLRLNLPKIKFKLFIISWIVVLIVAIICKIMNESTYFVFFLVLSCIYLAFLFQIKKVATAIIKSKNSI